MNKFKVWHIKLGILTTPSILSYYTDNTLHELALVDPSDEDNLINCYPTDVVLLLYTGCKDNSGIELYDKDVIHAHYGDRKLTGLVSWDDDRLTWWVTFIDGIHKYGDRLSEIYDFDIFGNSLANPQLIGAIE